MTEPSDRQRWTSTGELPLMDIGWPTCAHCGEDLFIDPDQISCEHCLISWDEVDESAKPYFTDPETPACAAPYTGSGGEHEYEHKGRMYHLGDPQPCILPSGHTSSHRHPYEVESWPLAAGEET